MQEDSKILIQGEEEITGQQAAELEEAPAEAGEIDQLRQQLEEAQAEAARNRDLYMRALAETENVKKRAGREREQYLMYASESFIKKLLSPLDSFEKAMANAAQNRDFDGLAKGVEMIYKNLMDVLKSEGVECIDCVGQEFDPHVHQPLMTADNDEHPDNIVLEELQKGYKLHNRVIRPSLVKVNQQS